MSTRLRDSSYEWEVIGSSDKDIKVRAVHDWSIWGWFPKSHQLGPTARRSDPITSHQAAAAQTPKRVNEAHEAVLRALQWGPKSDFELATAVSADPKFGRRIIPTSVGVRRKELQRLGLVADSHTKGVSDTGSPCVLWCLTNSGMEIAKGLAA